MAIMTCESCPIVFEGRPNRKYCSIDCRRKAEMKEREIKRKKRYDAWLAAMTPEEREWHNSIPQGEDLLAAGEPHSQLVEETIVLGNKLA